MNVRQPTEREKEQYGRMGEACIKWAWKKSEGHRLKILILLIWSVIALLIGAAVDNILGTEDSAPIILSVSLIVAGVAYWKSEPIIRLATKILPNRANQEYSSPDLEARQAQLEEFAAERNGDSETTDENKRILEQHVHFQLASGNWNVYSKSDTSAILWRNKKVNHVVHAILSLLTLFWLIIYIVMLINRKEERRSIVISPDGSITETW